MTTFPEVKNISISIDVPFAKVNDFLSVPQNFSFWAAGLGQGLMRMNDEWVMESPEGVVKVRFTEKNEFGIADHHVMIKPGMEIYVPLRAVPNRDGSEVILTLFHYPDMSKEKFAADIKWVEQDLKKLKEVLENKKFQ